MNNILSNLKYINISNASNELTEEKGIYFWYEKKRPDNVVYIGIALGRKGLRHRIFSQHLNPKYLEFRPSKHNSKDSFQLENAIYRIGKKGDVRKGIDKSSFRKAIGRNLLICSGEDTCSYITNNLLLKIFESNDEELLKSLEKELISFYKPIFNTSFK